MNEWFIPEVEDFPSQRALLHLGLNKAIRFYRELVVPGIGGVWFVRQLSWAVAGLALAKELKIKPAKIANAIEAFACKLEWNANKDEYAGRGKRAFNRDDDVWGFKELSDKKYYVQITYRMSTVRALTGLGLATGTRFNSMELTPTGIDLSKMIFNQRGVGQGGGNIQNVLKKWINQESIPTQGNIFQCLGRNSATNGEKQIVCDRIMADSNDSLSSPQRRKNLINAFDLRFKKPDLGVIKGKLRKEGFEDQVYDIKSAEAFDAMLECGRNVVYSCAESLAAGISTSELAKNKNLGNLVSAAKEFEKAKGAKHKDADAFAKSVVNEKKPEKMLKSIINRDGNILRVSGEKIVKVDLFDRRRETGSNNGEALEDVGTEESPTENKIRQLFTLWKDCLNGGSK